MSGTLKGIPPWLKGAIPASLVGGDQPWVNKRELGEGSALVDGGTDDASWNATSPRLHYPYSPSLPTSPSVQDSCNFCSQTCLLCLYM